MSERYYFDIDNPLHVLANAPFLAEKLGYTLSDADEQELRAYSLMVRHNAPLENLQKLATNSVMVRTLQYRYKVQSKREELCRQEEQRKQEEKRRRREWFEKHRKKAIIIAIISFVLLVVLGGAIAYFNNYNDYINDYVKTKSANGELRYKINFKVKRTEYNHLGTDITIEHTVGNKMVNSGDILPKKDFVVFKTVITEHDGIDDVGYKETTIPLPNYLTNARYVYTVTQDIKVSEAGGKRYPDAYAKYEVTITVTPYIDKAEINIFDVIFYK